MRRSPACSAAVFGQFAVCGSVRATWLWLRAQQLRWPLQQAVYLHGKPGEITWVEPTYHAVHTTLTHPAYAGAYVYGRTRDERYLGPDGALRTRRRKLPRDQWEVLIPDHHPGFTDWDTYLANQARIGANIRPQARQPGTGAVREGSALLQGLATCGTCGRKLAVFYRGPAKTVPNYYCQGSAELVDGRGVPAHERRRAGHRRRRRRGVPGRARCPPRCKPAWHAAEQLEHGHDAALDQHRRQVEQARYQAVKAERRYRAVDPENRLVARGLETEWNTALQQVADAEAELARRQTARPKALTPAERDAILALGDDLGQVWDAPTTTDKDRKQLLRTLLEEVNITARRDDPDPHARLVLRWKGGAITELTVPLRRPQPKIRTDDDTVDLVRRLAVHYPDAIIAGILNRQGRRTPRGLSYTAGRVQGLRHYWGIPRHQPATSAPAEGELLNVAQAARQLGIAPSTLLRWLNDGFIAGEQVTPGAPWRVRLTDQLRGMLTDTTPDGWVALHHASRALGISRQTVLQKVKRGELRAVLTRTGRRKGLRIEIPAPQDGLF